MVPLLLLLAACAGTGEESGVANNGDPFIELVTPVDGSTVCGTPLVVECIVENLVLVEPVEDSADAEEGTGHIDITMNGQDAAMVWDEHADLGSVADGEWQIKVELSNADHSPVEPYAGDLAYITVASSVCGQ